MTLCRHFLCLTLGVSASLTAIASGSDFNRIALSIAANSPQLRAARFATDAETASLRSENNLSDPEVEFGYLWGEGETDNKWNLSISQSFDWPGAYAARRKAIASGSKALEESYRATQLSTVLEVKLAMIDLVNSRKHLQLAREMTDTIQRLYDAVKSGVASGEVSRLDLNKLEIERVNLRRELGSCQRAYEDCLASLRILNGGHECGEIAEILTDYPNEPLESEETYVRQAIDSNPAITAARTKAESDRLTAMAERRMSYPGFSIGYTYEHEVPDHWHGITLGLTLPIFSNRHKAKAATLAANSAAMETIALESSETATITADRRKAAVLLDEIQTLRPAVESADHMLLLHKALRGGQLTLIEYLQEAQFFLQARKDFLETEYQYNLTLTRLNRFTLLD